MRSWRLNQSKTNRNLKTQSIMPSVNTKVAPVECDICSGSVVNRALYNHPKSGKCKLVQHCKDIAQLDHDDLKLTRTIITS